MRFLGRCLKYFLWSVFSIIVFLLLVGLAKTHRNVRDYVVFLNTNDWSMFHRSQPATWADPFWPEKDVTASIDDLLSDEEIEAEFSGMDIYDPLFEDELNDLSDDISDEDEDFGFVTDDTHDAAPEKNSTLQQLIEQRK